MNVKWDGFSEYKNFERELIPDCRTQKSCCSHYNMSRYKWKYGKYAYKTGFLFAKWDSRLQNRIFIYKVRFLDYKWDSRTTIYHYLPFF